MEDSARLDFTLTGPNEIFDIIREKLTDTESLSAEARLKNIEEIIFAMAEREARYSDY